MMTQQARVDPSRRSASSFFSLGRLEGELRPLFIRNRQKVDKKNKAATKQQNPFPPQLLPSPCSLLY